MNDGNDGNDGKLMSRRGFLKETATSAATAAATAAAISLLLDGEGEEQAQAQASSQAPSQEPITFGVIGTGVQGRELLSQLSRMPNVQVVALCDVYAPSMKKALEITGQVATYEDYRAMLEQEKIMQAVIVAAPTNLHAAMSIDALKAGKHVFCEAPMAHSIEECKAIAKVVKEAGKVFQVGHQRRYSPLYKYALNFVLNGLVGDIKQVRAQWHWNQSWRKPVSDQNLEKLLNWRLYKASSGGLMTENGSHQLDVINWFTKATPICVTGIGGIDHWKDGREVYDNVQVLYEYSGGIKVIYSSILTNSHEGYYELFLGSQGAILLSRERKGLLFKEPESVRIGWEEFAKKEKLGDEHGIVLDANATKLVKPEEVEAFKAEQAKSDYYRELEAFCACIRDGKEPACTVLDGLKSTVAALKANEAMEKGTKIQFTEDLFTV